MRLSALKEDVGYNPHECLWATVYVDGVQVNHCFTADEERGEAICFVATDDNKLIVGMYDDSGAPCLWDTCMTEMLKGRVEIRLRGVEGAVQFIYPEGAV
jgi:hypothetical protein